MEVFLVPVSALEHELYCEVPVDLPAAPAQGGFFRRLVRRFREVLDEAERDRRARLSGTEREPEARGWWMRIRRRTMRWAAEAVAEQRLLWQLRTCDEAVLVYPSDLTESDADARLRARLLHDLKRHARWLVVDVLGAGLSLLLVPVPGPNIIGYYFAFRLVAHFFSVRGARHGLDHTRWSARSSAELTEVRRLIAIPEADRDARLREIQSRLGLEHLAAFVARLETGD
jgi:hypothetical protein